jgi:excisionase family DNA binding protein
MAATATRADGQGERAGGLLFIEEAAALARVPVSTLRWWVATGKLKGTVRAGKRRLIPRRALAAALGVEVSDLS